MKIVTFDLVTCLWILWLLWSVGVVSVRAEVPVCLSVCMHALPSPALAAAAV